MASLAIEDAPVDVKSTTFTRFVYALSDPHSPHRYRYIGQTANHEKRLKQHTAGAFSQWGMKCAWLRVLIMEGKRLPKMTILKRVVGDNRREVKRIALEMETAMCKGIDKAIHPILNAPYWKESCVAHGVPGEVCDAFMTACMAATRVVTTDEGERFSRNTTAIVHDLIRAFPVLNIFADMNR